MNNFANKKTTPFVDPEINKIVDQLLLDLTSEKKKIQESIVTIRLLQKKLHKLTKSVNSLETNTLVNKKVASKKNVSSGIMSSTNLKRISDSFCELLDVPIGTRISYKDAVEKIRLYFVDFLDPSNKKNILIDNCPKLVKMFGTSEDRKNCIVERQKDGKALKSIITDQVTFFNFQIHLRKHFFND
jgi:hypothetical protein